MFFSTITYLDTMEIRSLYRANPDRMLWGRLPHVICTIA